MRGCPMNTRAFYIPALGMIALLMISFVFLNSTAQNHVQQATGLEVLKVKVNTQNTVQVLDKAVGAGLKAYYARAGGCGTAPGTQPAEIVQALDGAVGELSKTRNCTYQISQYSSNGSKISLQVLVSCTEQNGNVTASYGKTFTIEKESLGGCTIKDVQSGLVEN